MNLAEIRILKDAIRAVSHYNKHAWWQLKRETFEHGLQSYYPAQSFFERPAEIVTGALSRDQIGQLRLAWSSAHPLPPEDEQLLKHYAGVIVAEVVRRARVAGYRTENW